MAILTAENDRLTEENVLLRAQLTLTGLDARAEVEQQMKALQRALLPLLEPAKAQWQADKAISPAVAPVALGRQTSGSGQRATTC